MKSSNNNSYRSKLRSYTQSRQATTHHARVKIAKWLASRIRCVCRNTTDPITLEDLKPPLFKQVSPTTGYVYGFDPEALSDYFIVSKKCIHPITRELLSAVEIRRLSKLVATEKRTALMDMFVHPPHAAEATLNDQMFNDIVLVAVSAMLDAARRVPEGGGGGALPADINANARSTIIQSYSFIFAPLLHDAMHDQQAFFGDTSQFRGRLHDAIYDIEALQMIDFATHHFEHTLLRVIVFQLQQLLNT
jgi:hypothetical protein